MTEFYCGYWVGPDGDQHRCDREAVVVFRPGKGQKDYYRCAKHDDSAMRRIAEQLGLRRIETGIVPSASKPW